MQSVCSKSNEMKITIAACQQPLDQPLSPETITRLREMNPDFVSLPEHYPLPAEVRNLQESAALFETRRKYLQDLSIELKTVVVGGTLTENTGNGFYNTCYVFDDGKEAGFYRKVNPTDREISAGILKGSEFKVFELKGLRVGVLICADVLFQESFEIMASLGCEITFAPTASPLKSGESIEEKFERDRSIFLAGARRMNCPIVKTCGTGTTFGHPIQGRSLIATPERIVARAEPDQESTALILTFTFNSNS